jgi:hypothetical protein
MNQASSSLSPMHCHVCGREAVDRCYNCGELFCEEHGNVNCTRCETGIVAGDSRADRISAARIQKTGRPAWWRPQEAEDFEPPACQECQGLARFVCANCGKRYCPEHAGKNGLCGRCQRSRRSGNIFLAVMMLIVVALTVLGLLQAP